MCKFTNRLFVFVLLTLVLANGAPSLPRHGESKSMLDLFTGDYDYDLHYDQRQKGNENFRLKLDGFFIGMPAQESSALMLITDDLLENLGEDLLLGLGKSQSSTAAPENSLNYNKVDSVVPSKLAANVQKPETFVVEIPAPKKDYEARNVQSRSEQLDEVVSGSRTKQHIFHLLSLLRRKRRN